MCACPRCGVKAGAMEEMEQFALRSGEWRCGAMVHEPYTWSRLRRSTRRSTSRTCSQIPTPPRLSPSTSSSIRFEKRRGLGERGIGREGERERGRGQYQVLKSATIFVFRLDLLAPQKSSTQQSQ